MARSRAVFLGEVGSLELEHHQHHHDQNPEQSVFYGSPSAYAPTMYNEAAAAAQQQSQKFPAAMSPLLPADIDSFLRVSPEISTISELSQELQQSVGGHSTCGFDNALLQLEVPEVEECSTWMRDVLDNFPAIVSTTQELSPLLSCASSFHEIPPRSAEFSSSSVTNLPPISPLSCPNPSFLPEELLSSHAAEKSGAPIASSSPPSTSPTSSKFQEISSPREPTPADNNVAASSNKSSTPKYLKPRRLYTRRCHQSVANQKAGRIVPNEQRMESVLRERDRRDNMKFNYETLECLLPPAGLNGKRDRASLLHDSIHYLKFLQQRVEELKKTASELNISKSTRSSAPQPPPSLPSPLRSKHVNAMNPEMTVCGRTAQLVEYHIQVAGEDESAARLEKCRCRPDYMSGAMKVLEQLKLDVCRCTITKMSDYTICVIIAKPRFPSGQVASSSSVVDAFRSALELT